MSIAWFSLDPVNNKVDFYPHTIASKIETDYQQAVKNTTVRNTTDLDYIERCVLGSSFFNATIHINLMGEHVQTTSSQGGRGYYKPAGYRDVRRIYVPDTKRLTVYVNKTPYDEWRICMEKDNIHVHAIDIPENVILQEFDYNPVIQATPWNLEEYSETTKNKDVICWEWCRGTPETTSNLLNLDVNWWIPYNNDTNRIIEFFYTKNNEVAPIQVGKENKTIHFLQGSCYAKQKSVDKTKVRNVRRTVKTLQEVYNSIERFKNVKIDQIDISDFDEIPHEFICSISQDIMYDPVKTEDGHTYERKAIEKWFEGSMKSPLTGLNLKTTALIQNTELKSKIDQFLIHYKKED